MDDTWAFIFMFALFNLWECAFWLHRNALLFQDSSWGHARFLKAGSYLGNRKGGIVICNPLPPLTTVFATAAWPVTLTSRRVFAYVSTVFTDNERPSYSGNGIAYDDVETVSVDSDRLLINGAVFVTCPSSFSARSAAQLIQELRDAAPNERQKILDNALKKSFAGDSIKETLERFHARILPLTILCNWYWFYIFILFPFVLIGAGSYWWFYLFGGGLLVLHLPVLFLFYHYHRALFPAETFPHARGERFMHLLHMGLFPPAAIRARDALSFHLLAPYHPLAVASLLCDEKGFRQLARQWVLDLRNPLRLQPLGDELEEADRDYRQWMLKQIETLPAKKQITLEELIQPPTPADSDDNFNAYCPRCFCQYTAETETCEDCTGVPLAGIDGVAD